MISVKEAKSIIQHHITPLSTHRLALALSAGYTLAEDIYAKTNIPAFEQSSMDGYAIRFAEAGHPLTVSGEMQAGTSKSFMLQPFQAARIFTGAPLPKGADTVVMQEKVTLADGIMTIQDTALRCGSNVRKIGAEARKGSLAMVKGSKLTPAAIGFLAGIGFAEAEVYRSPMVGIIVTGKELQQPGLPLAFGQVYESSSYSLTAALEQAQINKINLYSADDQLDELVSVLKQALHINDVVLLTGGVSVGDYDFVIPAVKQLEVTQLFHKVKQKPGKPLFFGKKGEKVIFGLPGNPSSVLSCFYQYVLPALEILMNYNGIATFANERSGRIRIVEAILTHTYEKTAGLTHFLKAQYHNGRVTPLHAQESFRMRSFAEANCVIELAEEDTHVAAEAIVKVHLLPE